MEPHLIPGKTSVDDRGFLRHFNAFDPSALGIRRFYITKNHHPGLVRAWHGHKVATTYVLVLRGAAIVAAVEINDWSNPDPTAAVYRFVLSESNPEVLCIPAGYANGFRALTADCEIMFFSTEPMDSFKDDFQGFPARYWEPWEVKER